MDMMELRRGLLMRPRDSNLINIDVPFQNPDNTGWSNASKRKFTPGTHCYGLAYSNYWGAGNVLNYSISNGILSVTNKNVYGVAYAVELAPGAYSLTADQTNSGRASCAFYASDGTYLSSQVNVIGGEISVPNNAEITAIIFYCTVSEGTSTFSNVVLKPVA